jgi:sugar phosphate permease
MLARSRINPWLVVWLCFAALCIVMSARQSVSLMTDEWAKSLGWSKTFIGSGQTIVFVTLAIFSPVADNLADRCGARTMLTAGLLVVAAALMVFAAFPTIGLYIMDDGVLGGKGFAMVNMQLVCTTLARLFKENRGACHRHRQFGCDRRPVHQAGAAHHWSSLFFLALEQGVLAPAH